MLSKLKRRHELQVRASKGNLGLTKKICQYPIHWQKYEFFFLKIIFLLTD